MNVYIGDDKLKDSILNRLRGSKFDHLADSIEENWNIIKPNLMTIVDRQYGRLNLDYIKEGLSVVCDTILPTNEQKYITELKLFYVNKRSSTVFFIFDNVYCK